MKDSSTEKPKYCRREIGPANENISPLFCMKPIKTANALQWCNDCRNERLPYWPTDSNPVNPQEVA